jgi:hypothetical protein
MQQQNRHCPFCGGEPLNAVGLNADGSDWRHIQCASCGVGADPKIWNSRPAGPKPSPRPGASRSESSQKRERPPERVYYEGAMHDVSRTAAARNPWRYKPKFAR